MEWNVWVLSYVLSKTVMNAHPYDQDVQALALLACVSTQDLIAAQDCGSSASHSRSLPLGTTDPDSALTPRLMLTDAASARDNR